MLAIVVLTIASCKQDTIEGTSYNEQVKIYLPSAGKTNATDNILEAAGMTVDTVANTVNFTVPVYRGGSLKSDPVTVNVSVDNTGIDDLIRSNVLPANTVVIDADSYSINEKDTIKYDNYIMQGKIVPKIRIDKLDKYSGKVVAMGIKISNASAGEINESMNRVIVYFDADELSDVAAPRPNLVDKAKWVNLRIAANDNVTFTVNSDGSIIAAGGNSGHAGVYQAVQVKANRNYKVDMNVQGTGATDTWFEVYVGTDAPVQGADYSSGGTRIGLNTWAGCGKTAFNGLLSAIKCSGSGNIVKFNTAGTVYLLIKGGGASLGSGGIKMANIDFRRVD